MDNFTYKTSDFDYNLPEKLIAQTPLEPRDSSRLLLYSNGSIYDKKFSDIENILGKGDVLVVNNTKVLPFRLFASKVETNAKIEILLLKRIDYTHFEVLCRPYKRVKNGTKLYFSEKLTATAIDDCDFEGGKILEFEFSGVFEDIINQIGEMPLPHYIKTQIQDKSRYNTVYSEVVGSAAAPTAGLHFTTELIEKLKNKGVIIENVLLEVGLGTFRPLKSDDILEHKMHTERYELSKQTAERLNEYKSKGHRIIAVGTTTVRVLESCADKNGILIPKRGETNIFIYPPYKFKFVTSLITNFHLPKSTLLMLVSALIGRETTLKIYEYAVQQEYRFFSFGDAMMISSNTDFESSR